MPTKTELAKISAAGAAKKAEQRRQKIGDLISRLDGAVEGAARDGEYRCEVIPIERWGICFSELSTIEERRIRNHFHGCVVEISTRPKYFSLEKPRRKGAYGSVEHQLCIAISWR